jgi:hypothetical protein
MVVELIPPKNIVRGQPLMARSPPKHFSFTHPSSPKKELSFDQNNDDASRETAVELPVHFSPIFLYFLFLQITAAAHQRRQQPGV